MLPELAIEEFAAILDQVGADFLEAAEWSEPPVDALALVQRAGMLVALDSRLAGRARTVRLPVGAAQSKASILLRPESRSERRQWAIAHEIGEQLAGRVFAQLGVSPDEAPLGERERVANLLAARLLLPTASFEHDARACGWDLACLKRRYSTASHELIARRMLDFSPPVMVGLFDQGTLTWRKSNVPGRRPGLSEIELRCWRLAHQHGDRQSARDECVKVAVWPIHEEGWRREIMRSEILEREF